MNLGTKTISKKKQMKLPDDVIEKLKINKGKDKISFIWNKDTNEITLKVLRGDTDES